MRFLQNTYNPEAKDAGIHLTQLHNETPEESWESYLRWLDGKIIGEPQATRDYTVEQLKARNVVGVYVADNN